MKFSKKNIFVIILIAVILIVLSFTYVFIGNKDKSIDVIKAEPNDEITNEANEALEALDIEKDLPKDVYVYVCGEVVKSGVYKLPRDSRVIDAVNLAGGLTSEADEVAINMAKIITDEQQIYIPKIGEDIEKNIDGTQNNENTESSLININTASDGELKKLNGIGDVIAQNIIDYRQANGDFKSIEDIKKVSRIGEKLFEGIKDKITVN